MCLCSGGGGCGGGGVVGGVGGGGSSSTSRRHRIRRVVIVVDVLVSAAATAAGIVVEFSLGSPHPIQPPNQKLKARLCIRGITRVSVLYRYIQADRYLNLPKPTFL